MQKSLTLLHTNDLHSHFTNWARIVHYIQTYRDAQTRYVDIGDHADRAHPLTEATLGLGNIQLLNEAKVDFVTIGNNEGITFSRDALHDMYFHAKFPVIVANIQDNEIGHRPDWAIPYYIDTMDHGVSVAYVGYTAAMTDFYHEIGFSVACPLSTLPTAVEKLRGEVDAIVLLSHLGLPMDEKIAAQVEGIDVILGAHTHHALQEGKRVKNTLIAQAGKCGQYIGEVTLQFDGKTHQVIEKHARLIDPAPFPEDEKIVRQLQELARQSIEVLEKPITNLPRVLPVAWFRPSVACQQLCDELVLWCGTQLGMMNAGVLLEDIPKGVVTYGDIHRICPHPINPCVVEVSGADLRETVARAETADLMNLELKGFGFRGKVLGKMVYTGITVSENGLFLLGSPVIDEEIYKLATLDMYTFGFLFPKLAHAQTKTYFMPEMLRDVLCQMLKKQH
ncbi:bifunctional UDP-sugar hydrolase/5'-nucleotidase [Bacillus sp. FSL W7-1360]